MKVIMSIVAISLLLIALAIHFDSEACIARWGDDALHSATTGCMVNVNGIYVPEANVVVAKWDYVE